jgi:hypothetical protein
MLLLPEEVQDTMMLLDMAVGMQVMMLRRHLAIILAMPPRQMQTANCLFVASVLK